MHLTILESNPAPIACVGRTGELRYANAALVALLGAAGPQALRGLPWTAWMDPQDAAGLRDLWRELRRHGRASRDVELRDVDGNPCPVTLLLAPMEEDAVIVTAVPRAAPVARPRDPRAALEAALDEALQAGFEPVLLLAEVDRHKSTRRYLGAEGYEAALVRLQERARQLAGEGARTERIADDEFALLLRHCQSPVEAILVARELSAGEGAAIAGELGHLACSVGLSTSHESATAGAMIRGASVALEVARRQGGGCYHLFEPGRDHDRTERRQRLEQDLWQAVPGEQLHLAWQPIVDMSTGQLVGAECLLRWDHPELGAVGPAEFVPIAEESGSILPVGHWGVRACMRQARRWQRQGGPLAESYLSLNLSAAMFRLADVPRDISGLLRECKVDPTRIQLEITERLAMQDPETLRRLRRLGCRVALDDFGTGYSNLSLLSRVEIDCLKVDRSLVSDLEYSRESRGLLEASLAMANALGLDVVVEGVETEAQRQILVEMGAPKAQGFLFARPMPPGELEALVAVEGLFERGVIPPVVG